MLSSSPTPYEQSLPTLPFIQFSHLSLSSIPLHTIPNFPTALLFISFLNLDNNLLTSLFGIQQLMNLSTLSLNFNFISEKEELLRVKNKFMVKELAFIGNQIEKMVDCAWLENQGFTRLEKLNDVDGIGRSGMVRRSGEELLSWKGEYMLAKQHAKNDFSMNSPYFVDSSSPDIHYSPNQNNKYIQSLTKSSKQPRISLNPTNYPQSHFNRSYNDISSLLNSSDFIYVTTRNDHNLSVHQNNLSKKDRERYQSTGDTRRRKQFENRSHETSQLHNFQESPNFRNFTQRYHQKTHLHTHSFKIPQSNESFQNTNKHQKIAEFKLYPVDQQMTHNKERQVTDEIAETRRKYERRNELFSSSYKNMTPFNTYNPARHHIPPYQQIDEEEEQGNFKRTLKQKEIPIYKEAIAIAFYYRNLLEKVFRGFNEVRVKERFENEGSLLKLEEEHLQFRIKQHHPRPSKRSSTLPPELSLSLELQQQKLKRYAWMKLQLFVNYKKVMQKYQAYDIESHNEEQKIKG